MSNTKGIDSFTSGMLQSVAVYHALVTTAERELTAQLTGAGDADAKN